MKVKCPVAGCGYTVKGANDGFKHWQNYDEFHKTLHWNWINAFFSEIANSDWSDEVKFRFAYQRWHKQEKDQAKMPKHDKQEDDNSPGCNNDLHRHGTGCRKLKKNKF